MRIFSVFSFKGGVGRTALVASLGAHWAQRGKVVALVDMDLTAPGLSLLSAVKGWTVAEADGLGVGDMLDVFNRSLENNRTGVFDLLAPTDLFRVMDDPTGDDWGGPGKVYVIDAGRPDTLRPEADGAVIPHNIPPRHGHSGETTRQGQMRALAEAWRKDFAEWRTPDGREIDMVLVDCRTGFPELMDLTLGYLADEIVLVSGINPQNLEGLNLTLRALTAQRLSPVTLGTLTVVLSPIPASDDDATLGAIDRAHRVIDTVVKDLGTSGVFSSRPQVYTLPYSTRVANSDPPFLPRIGQTPLPYVQAVEVIAKRLDGREAVEAEITLKQVSVYGVSAQPDDAVKEEVPSSHPTGWDDRAGNLLAGLPPWHWPLDLKDDEAIAGERNRLIGEWRHEDIDGDSFLNLLCYAPGLLVKEKQSYLSMAGQLSKASFAHIHGLLEIQCAEVSRAIGRGDLSREFLDSLLGWGYVLGVEKSNLEKILFFDPLNGIVKFPMLKGNPWYWNWIGRNLYQRKNHLAEKAFRKALIISPDESVFLTNLALSLDGKPDSLDEINDLYQKSAGPVPGRASALNNYATFLWRNLKSFDKAETTYRQSIGANPYNAIALSNLATFLWLERGFYDEPIELYRRAIDLSPENSNTLGNFSGFLLAHGRSEEGHRVWERAIGGADKGPPGLTLELWFYAYAFLPDRHDEALAQVTQRLERGERSPGFNLSHCVAAARAQGHPDPDRVAALAERISSPRPQ